jgi:hypothetical protein
MVAVLDVGRATALNKAREVIRLVESVEQSTLRLLLCVYKLKLTEPS